jgi:hypothetical protein
MASFQRPYRSRSIRPLYDRFVNATSFCTHPAPLPPPTELAIVLRFSFTTTPHLLPPTVLGGENRAAHPFCGACRSASGNCEERFRGNSLRRLDAIPPLPLRPHFLQLNQLLGASIDDIQHPPLVSKFCLPGGWSLPVGVAPRSAAQSSVCAGSSILE